MIEPALGLKRIPDLLDTKTVPSHVPTSWLHTPMTMPIVSCEPSLSIQSVALNSPTKMTASAPQEVSASLTVLRKKGKNSVPLISNLMKKCTTETRSILSCEHSLSIRSVASSSQTKRTASAPQEVSASLTGLRKRGKKSSMISLKSCEEMQNRNDVDIVL